MGRSSSKPGAPPAPDSSAWRGLALQWLLLAGAVILVYSNSLNVPIHYDDELILQVPQVQESPWDPQTVLRMNRRRLIPNLTLVWGVGLTHEASSRGYLVEGSVVLHHCLSMLFHALNAVLVLALLRRAPALARSPPVPFFAALLFAVHPMQTQAVTYIVQRHEVLASTFILLAVISHVEWTRAWDAGHTKRFVCWMGSLVLFAVLACLSKEIAAGLPLLILGWEFAFGAGQGKPWAERGARLFQRTAPYLLVSVAMVIFAWRSIRQWPAGDAWPGMSYPLTQMRVHWSYWSLVFWPVGQSVDHAVAPSTTILDPWVFLGWIGLLSVTVAGILAVRRWPIFSFAVLWHLSALMITSSFYPIRDALVEHRLYLALIGDMTLAAWLLGSLLPRCLGLAGAAPRLGAAFCVVLALLLGGATHRRNAVWESWFTLWSDAVAQAPNKARPHMNLGVALGKLADEAVERGGKAEALRYHRQSIKSYETSLGLKRRAQVYYDLGLAWGNSAVLLPDLGAADQVPRHHEQAVAAFLDALRMNPKMTRVYYDLGNIYYDQIVLSGKPVFEEAIEAFDRAIDASPKKPSAFKNRAQVRILRMQALSKGDDPLTSAQRLEILEAAYVDFAETVRLEPQRVVEHRQAGEVALNLGILHARGGDLEAAQRYISGATQHFDDYLERAPDARQDPGVARSLTQLEQLREGMPAPDRGPR